MSDINEIDSITEFFQNNKVSIVKLSHDIDLLNEQDSTQLNGYINLSPCGEQLNLFLKKPIKKDREFDVEQGHFEDLMNQVKKDSNVSGTKGKVINPLKRKDTIEIGDYKIEHKLGIESDKELDVQ